MGNNKFTKEVYSRKRSLEFLKYIKEYKSVQACAESMDRVTRAIKHLIDTKMHLL